MIGRVLASLAGAAILAGIAHMTTVHIGGYESPDAILTWLVAFGIAVGSIISGFAISDSRKSIGVAILMCSFAGEAYNFLETG